jgi:acyl-CoA synthetase (AMP-forming)/AMP-acid ligase II
MIKTMGFRVSPDEISDVLQSSGLVTEAAIITEPDPQRGERIIACVVLRENGTLDQLRRFCGLELPRYMQPVRYVVMSEIPRNLSGKHDILQLRATVSASSGESSG